MPYNCHNPSAYAGKEVEYGGIKGSCVVFVQRCAGAPKASEWSEGDPVRGNTNLRAGTAIATFKNAAYQNKSSGNHAAIYISQTDEGILVWDQWKGRKVGKRLIRFKGGVGSPSNDGDAFSVIK